MIIECPKCFHVMDRHSCVGDKACDPSLGDVTICFRCGTVLVFDEKGVTEPDEETLRALEKNPVVVITRIAVMACSPRKAGP
jgi:hypothetical protein